MVSTRSKYITFFRRNPYPDQKRKQMVITAIHIAKPNQLEEDGFGTRAKYEALCGYSYAMYRCQVSRAKKAPSKELICKNCLAKEGKANDQ